MKENVLDSGSVELLGCLGNDLTVVNAARVSYAKESTELSDKDERLIRYLMRNAHGSPFEHCVFQFRVKAPLFVVRQWERHRIASYNEQSGRYVNMEPEFYAPDSRAKAVADACYEAYRILLADGVPKEQARTVLPLSLYTTFWWTVNARSLMNFLFLRNSEHAQEEIRSYASAVEVMFAACMPASYRAFTGNGRKAP